MENITLYEAMCIIDRYIEESKGNALDKLYGKKWEDAEKNIHLLDKAKELGMPREYTDKLLNKYNKSYNDYTDTISKHSSEDLSKHLYKGMSNLANRHDVLMTRSHKGKSSKLPDKSIEALHVMKNELGHGLNKEQKKEPGKYLKMQKEIDSVNGVKRESVSSTRLRIYESYDAGIITEEEKNDFLDIINSFEE